MWTEARFAEAKQLWIAGLSGSEIAKQLGGVTRNAVIGMLNRRGLAARNTPARPTRAKSPPRPRQAAPVFRAPRFKEERAVVKVAAVEPLNVPFLDNGPGMCSAITDTTQWEQRCCGHPVDARGPYCAAHRAIFYTPAKAKAR